MGKFRCLSCKSEFELDEKKLDHAMPEVWQQIP